MLTTLWTSKSGMNANQEKLDAISNNIANINTYGYKKVDVGFKDLLQNSLDRLGNPINDKDSSAGSGVRAGEWYRDNGQGVLQQTGNVTDIAIDGEGYYRVILADGSSLYTRDGAFRLDGMGRLVDANGNKLDIQYDAGYNETNTKLTSSNFIIDQKGGIFVKDNKEFKRIGEIPVYTAVGDKAFVSIGDSLFQPVDGVQVFRTRDADFYQGCLEGSNVDISQEFTDMIMTQRAFQLSSKGITTADEMWGMVNSLRR